jgi:flagellin
MFRDLTETGVNQMSGMVVSNRISAGVTLNLIGRYREDLLEYRAALGATTSRISTFVNTLQATNINTIAADSRISDADIAQDAASASAAQIRQQVAASLLGQANQAPRIALQLLLNS